MKLDAIAKALSNPEQLGLTPSLMKSIGVQSEDATHGRLLAQLDADPSHLTINMLAAFVVDDTDVWGDGEIYYWCIPTMVNKEGQVQRNPLYGLPSGAAPHKVGSLE